MQTPEQLGRELVREMRRPPEPDLDVETATDVLRLGADDLSDEELWRAVLAALDEAKDEGEYWSLGDGVIDESVRTRPELERRWREARPMNPKVAAVYRVMQDPAWNWTNADSWRE